MEKKSANDSVVAAASPSWEELTGSNNWEGLLEPLDLNLRRFLLRCGEFCQSASDAFDGDTFSAYYGSSRYGKKSFFHKTKFEFATAYDISSFLYATSTFDLIVTDKQTNFMGYIAVSTDATTQLLGRREIYVVWRGTETNYEWLDDAHFGLVSAAPLLRPDSAGDAAVPKVMDGWLMIYTSSNPNSAFTKLSAREQLHAKLRQLRESYKGETLSIIVTGHSLGASLAVLSAFDLVENSVVDVPIAAVVLGCPRVGDLSFAERVKQHINTSNLHILRINNMLDMVPKLPPGNLGYTDVGVELEIDGRVSPYLKIGSTNWHNLEGMLHVVAGWQGKDGKFDLVVKRSLALVNKKSELLNDDYKIPASWWVVENKGMILNEQGDWVLAPAQEDLPVPEF